MKNEQMTEDAVDRLIDEVARQLVRHDPPHAMSDAVMARIGERRTLAHRGLVWGSIATAALVAFMLAARDTRIATRGAGHQTEVIQTPDSGSQAPAVGLRAGTSENQPHGPAPALSGPRALNVRSIGRMAHEMTLQEDGIEPIAIAPIESSAIDTPVIQTALAPVEQIHVEPISVDPLSSSND